jgi:predicted nucleotidyltransferase
MRMTIEERAAIREIVKTFDPDADIFLFGSRIDDSLKGGDLDILVISETLDFSQKLTTLTLLKERLGDQKIDLIIASREKLAEDPFLLTIRAKAIQIG